MKKLLCLCLALCFLLSACSKLESGTASVASSTETSESESAAANGASIDSRADKDSAASESGSETAVSSDRKNSGTDKGNTASKSDAEPLPTSEVTPASSSETKTNMCALSIECASILNNISDLKEEKLDLVPKDGIVFKKTALEFTEGETAYGLLSRICREYGIQMEATYTPLYDSYYVQGIGNIYGADCGYYSGWMYSVNGCYLNCSCSSYVLCSGDLVEFRYTCDMGNDIGYVYIAD